MFDDNHDPQPYEEHISGPTPDYINQLGTISTEFNEYITIEDPHRKDRDTKNMLAYSRKIITTGTIRNHKSYRIAWYHWLPETHIAGWFLDRGFHCAALSQLDTLLTPYTLPHVYWKGSAFIHVFERSVPRMPNDKVYDPIRVMFIQYENVIQKFYPCTGDLDSIPR